MTGKCSRTIMMSVFALCLSTCLFAQSAIVKDFKPVCDTLTQIMQERTGVHNKLRITSIMKRGTILDFYFSESLGDFPWHDNEPQEFERLLRTHFPTKYQNYRIGEIYSRMVPLAHLVTPELGFDGDPSFSKQRTKNPGNDGYLVRNISRKSIESGLEGRTIALWQSHGRFYDKNSEKWNWQRPCLFYTVEDLFTQSFAVPYLIPMLENAGAYVIMPRERDFRKEEIIIDNDPDWHSSDVDYQEYGYGVNGPERTSGKYSESRQWEDAGVGFADTKAVYSGFDNPFTFGTARKAKCQSIDKQDNAPRAEWIPEVKVAGEYAVYVSYKSFPQSSSSAHYIVNHAGGRTDFAVNQKIGGGMWIYLGTFPFNEGNGCSIVLEAQTPEGYEHEPGSIVCADAVKLGGGMGNIERNGEVSGLPRNSEAARYFLQWSGADPKIYSPNEGKDDYKDDFMSRGDWSNWISEGSRINKKVKGKGIPVDLSFGFHSDAGVTPNDSIVGTLAIYTFKSEGKTELPSGESRMTSREYTDLVQSQIVNDIREYMNPKWTRRQIWDRGYRESRTPSSPAMLLELLSHQNFEDMKYGLDPEFKFIVGRAIYKGMLKYLSNRYGIPYTVQPLPIRSMAVKFIDNGKNPNEVEISWLATEDKNEPTSDADGFILYTRMDSGAFDCGKEIYVSKDVNGRYSTRVKIRPGHIYSWKISAYNKGGLSFPSEILCAGIPEKVTSSSKILIVNNFTRVSAPAFFDTSDIAGFDDRTDRGVGYIRELGYIGDMYQFRRNKEWISNDNPGFGASYKGYAGNELAGNTFDFPFIHGNAIFKTGRAFFSCSADAFASDSTASVGATSVDLICGKQVTTWKGPERQDYTIFPFQLQNAIRKFTSKGGNLIVSGSNIGTDIWDSIYPVEKDSLFTVHSKKFAREVLGYKWSGNHAAQDGKAKFVSSDFAGNDKGAVQFYTEPNEKRYCIESPDGISPASSKAETILRYTDSGISAGVMFQGKGYKTVCLGFPIETLRSDEDIYKTISLIMTYLEL